ncbi:MAG: succinylglutamate-semialdehyde dehydrogenase [Parachlamydiaceae bacterium]|nr:succinylglutamate-semialdehyde dehydrogenase [Parachlamydiaceae bacterium]
MPSHAENFINNQWEASSSGAPFSSRNPATEELVWQGQSATEKEVTAAVTAAHHAHPIWSALPIEERITYLKKFQGLLTEWSDRLSEMISKEIGKPRWEAKGEVAAMTNKIDISIEAYEDRCAKIIREHPSGLSVTRHKPHGVMAVFGPFNFPGHLPNGHIIPALLAGNTVVFKPSELAPGVGELTMQCWEAAGLPPGTINMVQGGRETGRVLVGQRHIDGLLFTGSWGTGLVFSEQFAKHPEKILALEMGGNNPLIFSSATDLKAAALTTIQSAFLTSGQRCSCARRLIVIKSPQGEAFVEELKTMMDHIKVGPYTDSPEPFMGPVINESAVSHLLAVQNTLKTKGAIPLREMHLLKLNTSLMSPGLMDVTHVALHVDEEVFGPFLQLIWVPNLEAAIIEANNTAFGLTAGLLSYSQEEYDLFYQRIRAGVINWNTPLTGASSAAPFGGIGRSGNFRPSAYYAADYCSYPVASLEAPEPKLPSKLPPGITLE